MAEEIPYSEFLRDIRRQKGREVEKPPAEPCEVHPQGLSRDEYDAITEHGRKRLGRPRPVWLPHKERWTAGAPVNPVEWQILIGSEPRNGERVDRRRIRDTIMPVCGWFQIHRFTFLGCVSRLQDKRLLKIGDGFRRSRIVDKWLFPDLTGQRAGGEWHRKSIRDYIDIMNRDFGCYTYADRGFYPGVEMPDVITVRPQLVEHTVDYDRCREPLKWDMEKPIYAEFKSAQDMREHPRRLKEQLDRYGGIPLYLRVEARIGEARDLIEEHGRREVDLLKLLREPESDMVYLIGSERPRAERSFEPVMDRIREALSETYDWKARLAKTGTDPEGIEQHDLILYDKLNTPKNVGQVIPDYAIEVRDFTDRFFDKKYLGRITTADYVYKPERKPTHENKTWKWKKRKTRGSRFRSFSA